MLYHKLIDYAVKRYKESIDKAQAQEYDNVVEKGQSTHWSDAEQWRQRVKSLCLHLFTGYERPIDVELAKWLADYLLESALDSSYGMTAVIALNELNAAAATIYYKANSDIRFGPEGYWMEEDE